MVKLGQIIKFIIFVYQIKSFESQEQSLEYNATEFVEYQVGNIPIILSIPHGGLKELDIPNRMDGCRQCDGSCKFEASITDKCQMSKICKISKNTDGYTLKIGLSIVKEISLLLGDPNARPHLIICHLRRKKLDVNREINEAAQGSKLGEAIYNKFHEFIRVAKQAVKKGLLLDFHGQSHKQNSSEMGYLVSRTDLNSNLFEASKTSIRSLAERTGVSIEKLINGPNSLGAFLELQDFKAVPSPRQPKPGSDKYYRGGFITRLHGSLISGEVDAIQIEAPSEVRMDGGPELRNAYSKALATAIVNFYQYHY